MFEAELATGDVTDPLVDTRGSIWVADSSLNQASPAVKYFDQAPRAGWESSVSTFPQFADDFTLINSLLVSYLP